MQNYSIHFLEIHNQNVWIILKAKYKIVILITLSSCIGFFIYFLMKCFLSWKVFDSNSCWNFTLSKPFQSKITNWKSVSRNDHIKKVKALVLVKLLSLNINDALIVNIFNVFFSITLNFGFIMSPASPNSTRKTVIGKTSLAAETAWNNVQLVISGKEGVETCRQGTSRQLVQQVLAGVERVLGPQGVPVEGPAQGS